MVIGDPCRTRTHPSRRHRGSALLQDLFVNVLRTKATTPSVRFGAATGAYRQHQSNNDSRVLPYSQHHLSSDYARRFGVHGSSLIRCFVEF